MTAGEWTPGSKAQVMHELIEAAGPGHAPAEDMADLAELVRTLLHVAEDRDTRIRLGGNLFDVVISASGPEARAAIAVMDEIQGGCGPVIDDPESGWLYWLVPPGSSAVWGAHSHGVCIGAPRTIRLPSLTRRRPPGPYWLRPSASDRLVPVLPLRDVLGRFRPEPPPHAALASQFEFTTP